jgi:PAS domain S-box-containing protein
MRRQDRFPFGAIVASAMDAVITVDARQRIVLFNAAAERVFRCPAAEALGSPLERFIPERFRAAHHDHIRHFSSTGVSTRLMGARLALSGLRADGEEFPIDASISQVTTKGRKFYTVILRDVTERQAAAAALERSGRELKEAGERLDAIIQSAMDAIITVDEDQRIVLFNAAAERIFGCPAAEAVGGPLDRFLPERFRAAHREHVRHFGRTGTTTRMMGTRLALLGLRANGEEFPIDASISQVVIEDHKRYTVILRDITERKRAEEALERSYRELRELSAVMHEVREAERLRIARELHDELAQWLTAIKMDASWLAARLPRDQTRLVEKAEKMKGLVDTTVAAVRRIAADLRPVMLDDLGLVAALEHLLHDLSQRIGIVVVLDADGTEPDFGEPLSSGLYRIAQEALTNVARHAQATEVKVELRHDGNRLVLAVSDNGRGFDPGAARATPSYGILGIRERAVTLGGAARIERRPEGGMLVEVSIPIDRYQAREVRGGKSTAG